MNTLQRFKNIMAFEPVDRIPIMEWAGYWDKTLDRWYAEGLPPHLNDAVEIRRFLGLDCFRQWWFIPRAKSCPLPSHHGGAIVSSREEYHRLKQHLYPKSAFDKAEIEMWAEEQKRGDAVVWITFEGFFWFPRTLLGIESHIYAFYDKPDLMHEINRDVLAYNLWAINEFCKICTPNFMTFAEDMSYNNGPMLSKKCFDEFLAPYYRQAVSELRDRDIMCMVDSDGDVSQLIPWLEEVGIEGILPLERMAGVDVARIRRAHPKFRLIGAFDKTIMHLGEAEMRKEFERLLPVIQQGGFILSVDHQTPPDVSLENYHCYVRLLKEYSQMKGIC